jgi:hypothetical protein
LDHLIYLSVDWVSNTETSLGEVDMNFEFLCSN